MSFDGSDDTLEYQGNEYEFEDEVSDEQSEAEYKLKASEILDDFDREWRGEIEEDAGESDAEEEEEKVKELVKKEDEIKEEKRSPEKEEEVPEKKRTRKKVVFFGDVDSPSPDGSIAGHAVDEKPTSRRKSIFDLDSYAVLASLQQKLENEEDDEEEPMADDDDDAIRFSDTMGIEGIARIDLSPLTQKIVGVVIDENVTTEFPWLYVRKEIIEDNLDLHSESSDFLPVKNYIERYPAPKMLLGYAPTTNEDEGQFYICLTEEARNAVARVIEARRIEQQDKVRNAILKTPGEWSHLGSGDCVNFMTVKRARPLYEIQIEASASQLKAPMALSDRKSDDQRDGYVEVVPYRESFKNVARLLVDKDVKAIPSLEDSEAQTILATQVNSSCQCQLNVEPTAELAPTTVKQAKTLLESLKSRVDDVCEEVYSNTLWDVYANDYTKLAESAVGPLIETRGSTEYVERQSYYEGKLCTGRVINDLAWHPHWTGVAAAVYTEISKSENLVGPKPFKEDLNENSVLIWSLDDSLGPKLILESKRQVTAVSFHPRNGNIVVGGCANGQITVWDITDKIEEVERVVVKTADQVKYETVLRSMTTWMKDTLSSMVVRPTVTSSLQYSQKGQITKIDWLSSYKKINERGILEDLPADATEDTLSSQFVTSSLDGSIAFYDLNWRPPEDKKKEAEKKKKKTVEKPASLVQSISPYKLLDNIFKPLYALIAQYDNESRNAIVTAMSLRRPLLRKQQVPPLPRRHDEVTERKYYETLGEKQQDEESIPTRIFIGTMRGECGLVSWEGYDFSTGITLTKEMCKWIWRKQLHDGPVIHAVRSTHLRDLIVTVGGKIFAVWREDFDEPILWRKSESRYTSCCWAAERPSVIIVGRNDGTAEIWDLFVKSHEPSATHSLSGRIITGIYAHDLPLNPQCVGFCDYNGALRIFLSPAVSLAFSQSDAEWMRQFVDREVERIKDFEDWRKEWRKIKEESSEDQEKTAEQDDSKKVSEAEEKLKDEVLKAEAAKKAKKKQRKKLVEEMHAKWVTRELGRMQVAILTKKGLREEELERRIEPVLRMKREARERDLRRQQVLDKAPQLFEDAVASNFPQQRDQLLATDDIAQQPPPPTSSPDLPSLPSDFIAAMDKASDEDIIREYEELESEVLAKIRERQELDEQQELDFSWRRLITEGIKRRRSMDVNLKARQRKTTHRPEDYDLSPTSSFESLQSRR